MLAKRILLTTASLLLLISQAYAEVYSYTRDATIIGYAKTYKTAENESLIETARKFDLGYNEIVGANPNLDPFVTGTGASVKIPAAWILPDMVNHEGIVVNLSEMRLFYFFRQKGSRLVKTFPIGIGTEGNDTPEGVYKIIQKIKNPSWHVPASIRKEKPELPEVVPPGPDNPLGTHAMRLSLGTYLIHGTDKPWAVGRRATHGCMRLYPEDIPVLFKLISVGTKVTIVRQPVKIGMKNGKVYIEVHKDEEESLDGYLDKALALLKKKKLLRAINSEKLYRAISEKRGMPMEISGWEGIWARRVPAEIPSGPI
jgi:L,D-transpeptidase ErfK/SrfK